MALKLSFSKYVDMYLYNDSFCQLKRFLEDESCADTNQEKDTDLAEIVLEDMYIRKVYAYDRPGLELLVQVVCEVYTTTRVSHNRSHESKGGSQWYSVWYTGKLEPELKGFRLVHIEEYSGTRHDLLRLSDSLIPVIGKRDLDKVASRFLMEYSSICLKSASILDPYQLAHALGLNLILLQLSPDHSVMGRICFYDCEIEYYDASDRNKRSIHADGGTVFVDPDTGFYRNLGALNNTIIHECLHWRYHRKAMAFIHYQEESVSQISCHVTGNQSGTYKTDLEWMEWQVNALSFRVQMPTRQVRNLTKTRLMAYGHALEAYEKTARSEYVIKETAEAFSVSKSAAKIRLIESGFEEARGCLIFLDGHYVPAYQCNPGTVPPDMTLAIGLKDAVILNASNKDFRELLSSGRFIFSENHVVLFHPRYVYIDGKGRIHLTDYARLHADECCIAFNIHAVSGGGNADYFECILNRDERSKVVMEVKYTGGYENSVLERQQSLLRETIVEEQRLYDSLPNDYLKSWEIVFQWADVNYKEVAERTGMNQETVSRIVHGKTNGTINNIVLMCLALHLPYKVSSHLIEKSPCNLSYQNPNHVIYDFALRVFYGFTVKEVKERIAQLGADPL